MVKLGQDWVTKVTNAPDVFVWTFGVRYTYTDGNTHTAFMNIDQADYPKMVDALTMMEAMSERLIAAEAFGITGIYIFSVKEGVQSEL